MKLKVDPRLRRELFRHFDALGRRHTRPLLLNAMRRYVDMDRIARATNKRIARLRRELRDERSRLNGHR